MVNSTGEQKKEDPSQQSQSNCLSIKLYKYQVKANIAVKLFKQD